ncbi:hypothetical protein HYT00_02555 [Candidatus Giovannonibacteria bacterium]|nr:hypothetical protein [Candidatus Giovannonibacteria bacterium]
MKYSSLENLIEKMKSSPRVKGIFTTGTTASKLTPSSDIDLVVVLDKNEAGIKLVYTTVEKHFSDIFFFDVDFLNQLKNKREVFANNFEGMFLEWLIKGKIEHDPDNLLFALKKEFSENPPLQKVDESEKRDFWVKTNYNYIANLRYYSGDDLYKKALEMRLLYSVSELINAYFSFRGVAWRGEKAAIKYLEKNDQGFLSIFEAYSKSNSLEDKMKRYEGLFGKIFFGEYQKWDNNFVITVSNQNQHNPKLESFWNQLVE